MPDLSKIADYECGHDCCPERQNPYHSHFLQTVDCPPCIERRAQHQAAWAEAKRLSNEIDRLRALCEDVKP